MSATIALFFCTVFVLVLLRTEAKQSQQRSAALWIPTIWLLLIGSKGPAMWLSPETVWWTIEEGNPWNRLLLTSLLGLGFVALFSRRFNWSAALKGNRWLVLLVLYMLLSVSWSDLGYVSFKRWIRNSQGVIMAFVIASETHPRKAMESVLRRTVYVLIPFSALLIKYFPDLGVVFHRVSGERMWIGVTMHKNSLGILCLVSAFFLMWTLIRRNRGRGGVAAKYQIYIDIFLLLLTFWMLKGPPGNYAYSATALGVLAAGILFYFSLLWNKRRASTRIPRTWVGLIAAAIGIGTLTPMVGGATIAGFSHIFGRDSTLTGRTRIWDELIPAAMHRPIFGHGFGSFWTTQARVVYGVTEAHNGYLDTILDLGLVGLLLLSFFLLAFARKARQLSAYDYDWSSLCLSFLFMAVLHNAAESSFNTLTRFIPALVVLLSASTATGSLRTVDDSMIKAKEGSIGCN